MKKLLQILGGVFLLLIVGFIALLVWAQREGAGKQEAFFQAVLSGQPQQVYALLDPALVREIDEPVLAAWMQAVRDSLGAFQSMSKTDFNTSTDTDGERTIVKSEGTVVFEKGEARSALTFADGRIVSFNVESERLGSGWFRGPADDTVYRTRAEAFIRETMEGEPRKAYAMMHPALQEKVPLATLQNVHALAGEQFGPIQSLTVESAEFLNAPDGGQKYLLVYAVQGEEASTRVAVEFSFTGLQGVLTAFDFAHQ